MSSGAPARSQPRPPPRLPDRYRLRRHIASGGMASVWCAEDRLLDRTVAIKILAERFAHDQLAVRRFKREARAAARVCGHAHVVTIFDVGDSVPEEVPGAHEPAHGRAFIVMEYLAGGTVADAIRVGAVRRHEALRWLGEAASALDHAHAAGIVHRDIKPANFLLDRSRVLHVADFGIARLVSEDTITSSEELFGTAAYLSPEQALGRPATSASDGYALAVAAFELLVGERPFTAAHFAAQARQHVEEPPPPASERNRSLPTAVDRVLQRGMAKEADARFGTASELVAALARALTEVPTPAPRPVSRVSEPRRPGAAAGPSASARDPRRVPAPASRHPRGASPASPRPSRHRRGGRVIALAALLVVVAGVAAAALAARSGSDTIQTAAPGHGTRALASSGVRPRRAPPAPARARVSTAQTPTTTTTSTPNVVSTAPAGAEQLQATGHQQMLNGDYQTAVGTLRQAVSAAVPGSLTYAYALYDLGRSLVLGGNPSDAIPILQQRLKINNQTAVVRQMLDQALRAAGRAPASSPPTQTAPSAPPAPGAAGNRDHGHAGVTGGAGLAPRSRGRGRDHGPALQGQAVEHVDVSFTE